MGNRGHFCKRRGGGGNPKIGPSIRRKIAPQMMKNAPIRRTRCTQGVRVVFSVARIRFSNSARMNKLDFTTKKIGSVHMTVFEIVAHRNVDNWTQLLK